MTQYDVKSAVEVLRKYYITDSIQMVTKWIREGKIIAYRTENRKNGWIIEEENLNKFIDQ